MAEYNFEATARIPVRPLSDENRDLALAKEIIVDYVNAAIYIKTANGDIINVTASATQILEEVMNKINEDPTIITSGTVTLPSGDVITLSKFVTNVTNDIDTLDSKVTDLDKRVTNLESNSGGSTGSGSTSVQNMTLTVSSAGTWTAVTDSTGYYQDIVATGMLATDTPIVDLVASESYAAAEVQITEFGKIYKITTAADIIRVYATSQLSSDITLQLKIIR